MNSIPSVVLYGTNFAPIALQLECFSNLRGLLLKIFPVDNDRELRAKISQKVGELLSLRFGLGNKLLEALLSLSTMALTGELDRLLDLDSTGCSKGSSDNN